MTSHHQPSLFIKDIAIRMIYFPDWSLVLVVGPCLGTIRGGHRRWRWAILSTILIWHARSDPWASFSHVAALEYRRATQVLPPEACHRWDFINLLYVSYKLWMTLAGRCLPSQTTRESLPDLVWRPRYHASRCRDIPALWLRMTYVFNIGHERLSFIRIEYLTLVCVQKITKNNHWHHCYLLTQTIMRLSTGSEHLPKTKLFCAFEHYLLSRLFVYHCPHRSALTSMKLIVTPACPYYIEWWLRPLIHYTHFTIMRNTN